jgi:hypothetical protein
MKRPRVEGQAERGKAAQARAEIRLPEEMQAVRGLTIADDRARVPRARVAHAAEAPAAGPDVRLQHWSHAVAEREVGEAHDARGDARRPVGAARAHRRHAGDELGLAHGPHLLGSRRAIHRMALHEDGGDDVVAGADVVEELVQEVAVVGPLPQVVMRVDDGQVGLEDRLRRLLREPGFVGRVDAAELRRADRRRAHRDSRSAVRRSPAASARRSGRAAAAPRPPSPAAR